MPEITDTGKTQNKEVMIKVISIGNGDSLDAAIDAARAAVKSGPYKALVKSGARSALGEGATVETAVAAGIDAFRAIS